MLELHDAARALGSSCWIVCQRGFVKDLKNCHNYGWRLPGNKPFHNDRRPQMNMRILCGLALKICHWVGRRTPKSASQQWFLFTRIRKAPPAFSHREYVTGPVITFRDLVVHVPTKDGSRSAATTAANTADTISINLRNCVDICADSNLNTSGCWVWRCRRALPE